jgi:hypothetical protein
MVPKKILRFFSRSLRHSHIIAGFFYIAVLFVNKPLLQLEKLSAVLVAVIVIFCHPYASVTDRVKLIDCIIKM